MADKLFFNPSNNLKKIKYINCDGRKMTSGYFDNAHFTCMIHSVF